MKSLLQPLGAAVIGGLVVAGTFLALGVTGKRSTQTVVEEAPAAAQSSSASAALTPHAIYVRSAPGVVFVRAKISKPARTPFALGSSRGEGGVSTGSGFVIDAAGDILTSYSVIAGTDAYQGVDVEFSDGLTAPALELGADPDEDLAVLRVNSRSMPHLKPLKLGDSTTVRVGDPALALGNPFGSDRTLTSTIVSALQRELPIPAGGFIANVIQTQMPVYPGNSGGPLLDADGRVIGVDSQVSSGDGARIAFAVPIDTAKRLLARLALTHPSCGASLRCGSSAKRSQNQVLRNNQSR
jgi:S1-C subfamily serine protease